MEKRDERGREEVEGEVSEGVDCRRVAQPSREGCMLDGMQVRPPILQVVLHMMEYYLNHGEAHKDINIAHSFS